VRHFLQWLLGTEFFNLQTIFDLIEITPMSSASTGKSLTERAVVEVVDQSNSKQLSSQRKFARDT